MNQFRTTCRHYLPVKVSVMVRVMRPDSARASHVPVARKAPASSSTLINHSRSLRIHEVFIHTWLLDVLFFSFSFLLCFSNTRQSCRLPCYVLLLHIHNRLHKQKEEISFGDDLFIEHHESCAAHKVLRKYDKSNSYLPKHTKKLRNEQIIRKSLRRKRRARADTKKGMQSNLKSHKCLMAASVCVVGLFTWEPRQAVIAKRFRKRCRIQFLSSWWEWRWKILAWLCQRARRDMLTARND